VPTLAAVTAALADLQTAEAAALARTKGAVTARNEERGVLVAALRQLRAHVQAIADAEHSTFKAGRVEKDFTEPLLVESRLRPFQAQWSGRPNWRFAAHVPSMFRSCRHRGPIWNDGLQFERVHDRRVARGTRWHAGPQESPVYFDKS
jgi:hypothetical protein